MDLALQIALTIAAAAGIWAWIIADWLPRQWVLSNDRSPAVSDETHRWIRRLEAGMVWLNDHMYSHGACQCAWGGVKHSGIGRAHSKFGFYECVNIKQMVWEPSRTRNFWWHPYDESLGRAMDASAKLLYGRDADKWGALRRGAVPLAKFPSIGVHWLVAITGLPSSLLSLGPALTAKEASPSKCRPLKVAVPVVGLGAVGWLSPPT